MKVTAKFCEERSDDLISKNCKKSIKIQQLEALLRRLPKSHPKKHLINEDLAKYLAGYKGELSIDYYLATLPKNDFHIFYDLRLCNNQTEFFQLDVLVLSSSFLLIIEVKNYQGELYFDRNYPQLIRKKRGVEEAFKDPIQQVFRQRSMLEHWIKQNKFPPAPIEAVIVIANPSTIVRTSPEHQAILKNIIPSDYLLQTIAAYQRAHTKEISPNKVLQKLSKLLLSSHMPLYSNILEIYGLKSTDLLHGIHCPACTVLTMERRRGYWLCKTCKHTSKDAHRTSIMDYALLISPSINNQELRAFLQLHSPTIANRLLKEMKLKIIGKNKNRRYVLV